MTVTVNRVRGTPQRNGGVAEELAKVVTSLRSLDLGDRRLPESQRRRA